MINLLKGVDIREVKGGGLFGRIWISHLLVQLEVSIHIP